ncbi:L-rhamnose-binding lectin CSL2-like [Pseudoliparis swirei]|uniref:L-rhamnose-binding lectin CSL2-like n=1 Tax=Pseudoliparis swirei TaxID=2059687 RepID=UPI0024BE141E|nr:L-rhamnose-binding lectin CSL2-like [Pseudoliparis swirei]
MLCTRLTIIALLAATQCLTSDGFLYDVACPGVNGELQCPPGQVMEVKAVDSGLESDADCTDRTKSATVLKEDSLHSAMIYWVKLVCDYLEQCRLPKPDAGMFQHNYSNASFIQVTYDCRVKPADVITVVACENDIAEIQCENGKVQIETAKFGRFDKTTCTKTPLNMTFAASFPAKQHVKDKCNGLGSCSVNASMEELGPTDPSYDHNYLIVDYICVRQ